ncbi:uncharacterized protein SAPINGB_P004851 [Magnusiomyces paraingens]|uniref:Magnesium transporter n=1 Tax=Magnusiomyces paraingens TaxID=2606893 RepID=A0A5E8BZV1_9ASCO|nr:uncharacterized protein SAPINGB_P004851 [Saprochaete ingens]VVT56140.1 unnamed protein product [Saprochaete ingens]
MQRQPLLLKSKSLQSSRLCFKLAFSNSAIYNAKKEPPNTSKISPNASSSHSSTSSLKQKLSHLSVPTVSTLVDPVKNTASALHIPPLLSSGSSTAADTNIEDLILERSLLTSTHRSPGDNLVRCTVFDPQGNVKVVSGEFKRSELLSKHGLLPRDLRKLDTGVSTIVPSILVRQNSILVNLLHIRALIKAEMVIIFDAYGSTDSQTQSIFMYDLTHKLRGDDAASGLPYELRALEAIFISVVTSLDAEMQVLTTVVNGILRDLETNIDRSKLRHLLIQSKKLSAFLQKATLIRDAIDELLEQDEDLAGLYLTEKQQGLPRDEESDHSEVEMLLESYYKHCDEIVQTVDNLVSNIRSTEEIINIILDSNRNSLMLLDLKFQIGTLGLGAGAFVSALYGMNLQNFIEETNWGFGAVTGVTFVSTVVIIIMSLRNLRRVQRVTMMSNESMSKRSFGAMSSQSSVASSLFQNGSLSQRHTAMPPSPSKISTLLSSFFRKKTTPNLGQKPHF